MRQVATFGELVDGIEEAARGALDELLRESGAVLPPTVHMLTDRLEQPYVGYVSCRPFHRGDDAYRAIAKLGELPGAVEATRLVATWEAQDLNVALGLPADPQRSALIVLDADMTAQEIRSHPLQLHRRDRWHRGALVPEWGPSVHLPNPPLPEPIARLLVLWRLARGGDLDGVIRGLETAGYRIGWAAR